MTRPKLVGGKQWRIRLIAALEALKGVLALGLGFGVVATLEEPLTEAAQELVIGLHLDPSRAVPDALIDWTSEISRSQTWLLIASALAYAGVRFAEAYGLWNDRRWAAWVAALSGGIYLPMEVYELTKGLSWVRLVITLANVAIVGYMATLLWQSRGHSMASTPSEHRP